MDRRQFLAVGGGVSVLFLAGCSGEEEAPREPAPDGWFEGVRNYDGFEDHTGEDQVTVLVGAGEGGTSFEPPAISVSPGTTVVYEWTGRGGGHNVEDPNEDGQIPRASSNRNSIPGNANSPSRGLIATSAGPTLVSG
ncbi:MAG: hypothetical protein U5K37_12985 [Natrialbaceae archaeon]|nr:hypothetical protein [Natrialbaceae archaeon]